MAVKGLIKTLGRSSRFAALLSLAALACGPPGTDQRPDSGNETQPDAGGNAVGEDTMEDVGVRAMNAFYYYADVDAAWEFYTGILGFETVADFGFAKILQVAPRSFLTLVDAERGMHSTDEPKSVTLAVVTEQVAEWYEYLTEAGVPMRAEFDVIPGRPHDGFVAIDPEGYLLEFERFNEHDENVALLPVMARTPTLYPDAVDQAARPSHLGIQATVLWLYYDDIPGASRFYETALGLEMIVDQGWAKVYPVSSTGYVGLVDGSRGLHQATQDKAVTVSFLVDDIEAWFDRMRRTPDFEFRTEKIGDESGRVRTFVGYDVEGYYLEWDTFLDVAGNEALLETMHGQGDAN